MTPLHELDLLSPEPYPLAQIGHVCSPTLRQIASIGYEVYCAYLSLLSLRGDQLAQAVGVEGEGNSPFALLIEGSELRALLGAAFSFFMTEEVVYSAAYNAFFCMEEGRPVGRIDEGNYEEVCSCILQRNHAGGNAASGSRFHNSKAREIYEKLQRAREKTARSKREQEPDTSLPNLISALCAQHNSIHMGNVWDLTIYQFYDQFLRQSYLNQQRIHAMNYACWGGEFDPGSWYQKP